jgi:hypothetical protein
MSEMGYEPLCSVQVRGKTKKQRFVKNNHVTPE